MPNAPTKTAAEWLEETALLARDSPPHPGDLATWVTRLQGLLNQHRTALRREDRARRARRPQSVRTGA
jgi:hypothetical protein